MRNFEHRSSQIRSTIMFFFRKFVLSEEIRLSARLCLLIPILLGAIIISEGVSQPRRPPKGRFLPPPLPTYPPLMPLSPDQGAIVGPVVEPPPHIMAPPISSTPMITMMPAAPVEPAQLYQGDFHLELSETFLQRLFSRFDISSGEVQDFVSGAAINGQQTTQTQVSIDCQPCAEGAHFEFVVQGTVNSATNATTPQATIQQQGNTQFRASKRVMLNGETIMTQRTNIQVLPNQTVVGAQAQSPLPIFGNLADRIAYKAALARLPESNRVAGEKVMARLQPQIDSQIDSQLSQANLALRDQVWSRLKGWNVSPEYKGAFSTSDRLHWDYRLGNQPLAWTSEASNLPVPGNTTTVVSAPVIDDVVIRAHDSLFSTVAARRQLGGKTISLNDLRDATDRFLLLLAQEVPSDSPALPMAVNFTFDQNHPLQATYRENYLDLILRGTFQAGNLPATDPQQIRLRVEASLEPETFTIKVTDVQVREVAADGSVLEPGITQSAIAAQLRTQMAPITLKRSFPVPTRNGQPVTLLLADMKSRDHWVTITLDAQEPATDSSMPIAPSGPLAPVPDPTFQPSYQNPAPTPPFGPSFPVQ